MKTATRLLCVQMRETQMAVKEMGGPLLVTQMEIHSR